MREGIKIGEIKKAVEKNRKLATMGKMSSLENWYGVYDASISSFAKTFYECLPEDLKIKDTSNLDYEEETFVKYIEETLFNGEKHNLTAVEFGGPGSQLFRGFTRNFFTKTVGICLQDIRNEGRKYHDKANNHSLITGDIMEVIDTELITKVTQTLGLKKTDLIISRMVNPLNRIEKKQQF